MVSQSQPDRTHCSDGTSGTVRAIEEVPRRCCAISSDVELGSQEALGHIALSRPKLSSADSRESQEDSLVCHGLMSLLRTGKKTRSLESLETTGQRMQERDR